ncbi:DUF2157 domain-containing protein [Halobacillus sp. A5]|uniref:DUF2157 domain-containing protein n=1 Tax=Halobacillus sp. A5 TaxID=2880263 RepID=UPI0020A6C3BB|nr:DUF2157 domain-containing protein [Halobacillus sp. A5]MCP3026715.1 DUF2157 domain-containing protein [Halobacillus sp. A5]
MNRGQLEKESGDWVKDGIITTAQRNRILSRYEKKSGHPVLLTFAALFIGLGFLTFIASNWSALPDMVKMSVLLFFLVAFYGVGAWVYQSRSKAVGLSLLLIALCVFGSGIFLTGQMYNFTSFSAFPFLVWSLAAFGLLIVFQESIVFIAALIIITAGQIYSGSMYQDFYIPLGVLFLAGMGWVLYRKGNRLLTALFAVSYAIQSLVFIFSYNWSYYWLILLFLLLYIVSHLPYGQVHLRTFGSIAVLSIFTVNVFQVFLLGFESEDVEYSNLFFLGWSILFIYAVIQSAMESTKFNWIDLLLFIPVFRIGAGDLLSLLLLFAYSLGWLLAGYRKERSDWVAKGTAALLITTFVAYFQLAWAFMDRSIFFFTGGLILFVLSYFLERKRRQVKGGETE